MVCCWLEGWRQTAAGWAIVVLCCLDVCRHSTAGWLAAGWLTGDRLMLAGQWWFAGSRLLLARQLWSADGWVAGGRLLLVGPKTSINLGKDLRNMKELREDFNKKYRLCFGHCPKVALTSTFVPPILDNREVTFVKAQHSTMVNRPPLMSKKLSK